MKNYYKNTIYLSSIPESYLSYWLIQIHLINFYSFYFKKVDLLIPAYSHHLSILIYFTIQVRKTNIKLQKLPCLK